MLHTIAPAGTPISFCDLYRIARSRVRSGSCTESFREKLKAAGQSKHCFFLNSGRSGLYLIIQALSSMAEPAKDEIVIPAYTCFSVPAAIAKSGLKVRPIDIDPETMDFAYEHLQTINPQKTLAIIGCNLFGIPSDWKRLRTISKEKEAFLIDDAAQAMGEIAAGGFCGTLGDAGLYSLGRGKNMSTCSGGIVMTDNGEISSFIENRLKDLRTPGAIADFRALITMAVYTLFLRPSLYWFPDALPFLGLGKTIFDKNFPTAPLTRLQICAGSLLFDRLQTINSSRRENARRLAEGILALNRYRIPGFDDNTCPAYIRMPLLCRDSATRDRAVALLRKKGIGATVMYPSTILQIRGINRYLVSDGRRFAGADKIASCLLTLPTHQYLRGNDILKIIQTLSSV
jgi:perosamine synthetase